jgi:type II secretory pathway pseudopilin PulG
MLRRLKTLGSQGDTIVEVLVVLAVLGLAISVSYATANRSLTDTRQAQENSQATEYVLAQVEALRTLRAPGNPQNIYQAGPYCIQTASLTVVPIPVPTSPPAACIADNLYDIAITGPAAPSTGGKFTVTAKWDDIEGQGKDTVTVVYRLYQQ